MAQLGETSGEQRPGKRIRRLSSAFVKVPTLSLPAAKVISAMVDCTSKFVLSTMHSNIV